MSAANYPVTFGYKAQDGYYYGTNGIVGKYHRGNDRPCPIGTPIIIGTHTIGLTGATGLASGPHLHNQAMIPNTNTDVDPAPYEFKYGEVVAAGWHNQFGNYIKVRTNGIDLIYAHLSKINVSVGQQLAPQSTGGNLVFQNIQEVTEAYVFLRGAPGTQAEMSAWVGQPKQRFFTVGLPEANNYRAERDQLRQQLAQVQQALANEQAKPPKEIVKEVVKIVEKPVEVVKEVPLYVHDQETKDNVNAILKLTKTIRALVLNLFKRK